MPRIAAIEIVEDRTSRARCDEGFLRLRRLRARNRRADGSASPEYPIDVIDRPTLDAVGVCLWARTPGGIEVLTRRGLRPAAYFRKEKPTVLPEPEYLLLEEIVAGVLEPGERGEDALRRRAAEEVREEVGVEIAPERLERLGGPFFVVPGIASEKIHLVAGEIARFGGAARLHLHRDDLSILLDQIVRFACQAQCLVKERSLELSPAACIGVDDPSAWQPCGAALTIGLPKQKDGNNKENKGKIYHANLFTGQA